MADPASCGNSDRDIEHALITLKKGTQLIKYSRKGKPKFCPFRLSPDETTLIWYSKGTEKKTEVIFCSTDYTRKNKHELAHLFGPVFRRYLRPDKEYLSFSLVYNGGERSLDLICKDKSEADLWIAGLKASTSTGQDRNGRRTQSDLSDIVAPPGKALFGPLFRSIFLVLSRSPGMISLLQIYLLHWLNSLIFSYSILLILVT